MKLLLCIMCILVGKYENFLDLLRFNRFRVEDSILCLMSFLGDFEGYLKLGKCFGRSFRV